jgi:indolepyruvate ferredoxin oxidoreductase alpha subunit
MRHAHSPWPPEAIFWRRGKVAKFLEIVESPAGSKFILQGNEAFALGLVHAGYHSANGYPGTPSTEVIDRSLTHVQDRMTVGWAVNEAVAVGVAVGHALAGYDTVVTMKIPGVFQAGDPISTSAFYHGEAGALVIFAATDYVPSSTQHVVDARYFFASCRLPVLEPRNHREMYEIAWTAADISRKFNTPVVVLASGILTHSEGLVITKPPRTIEPRKLPGNLHDWMLVPGIARANYNKATAERIPALREWAETSSLISETHGADDFGIIVNGEADMITREALSSLGLSPSILSLSITNPIPAKRIKEFAGKFPGKLYIVEDGDKFLEEKIRLLGIPIIGKDEFSTITNWEPETVIQFLAHHLDIKEKPVSKDKPGKKQPGPGPVQRPPSICPGCTYRAFGLAVQKLKRKKKLYASFGDIGCSTLLYFLNALDTVLCMGASDSMRQGFVLSRPDMAHQVISVIGDSCECHSGLDSTRNAVFRNTPGVKVILDNRTTAMTGGQPAPSSEKNLDGTDNKFVLEEAVAAEKGRTRVIDAFDLKAIESALKEALDLAQQGEFSTLILQGQCVRKTEFPKKIRKVEINYEKCKNCGLCDICPGIELTEDKIPRFTSLCTNCGANKSVCMQVCPFGAIQSAETGEKIKKKDLTLELPSADDLEPTILEEKALPKSLRVAIRGVGGQGNLFFGRVLSEMALRTPYANTHIVKADTHGMAQLGGPVISTFACGKVHSPLSAPNSVDVLVVMEMSEILRPGFLDLLKPGGTIIMNTFKVIPAAIKTEDYPTLDEIKKMLENHFASGGQGGLFLKKPPPLDPPAKTFNYFDSSPAETGNMKNCRLITIDANEIAAGIGDKAGRSANAVVLGLLSTIEPFDAIPLETWMSALMAVSREDLEKSLNYKALKAGRAYRQEPVRE